MRSAARFRMISCAEQGHCWDSGTQVCSAFRRNVFMVTCRTASKTFCTSYFGVIKNHRMTLQTLTWMSARCFFIESEEAKGQSEGAHSPGCCVASHTKLPPGRRLASTAPPEQREGQNEASPQQTEPTSSLEAPEDAVRCSTSGMSS